MNPKKLKGAYASFIVSFIAWIVTFIIVCFPNGKWASHIQFSNGYVQIIFFASGIVSTVAALIIGLDNVGIVAKIRNRRIQKPIPSTPIIQANKQK